MPLKKRKAPCWGFFGWPPPWLAERHLGVGWHRAGGRRLGQASFRFGDVEADGCRQAGDDVFGSERPLSRGGIEWQSQGEFILAVAGEAQAGADGVHGAVWVRQL